ncbi:hypothetical protein [Ulvibacterium sp.]|uniref:hypothetical protein n=1 Tax=Ulvibacterium sp. TaxID=2665914 RepID=UPI003BA8F642
MKKSNSVWIPMYRMTRNLCFIMLIGIVLLSCNKDSDDPLPGENRINLRVGAELYNDLETKRLNGKGAEENADFTIVGIERSGTLLRVDVSYGGGCQNHYFDVVWDGIVQEIFPCKTGLIISHRKDNNDFGCNRVITDTLEIDLAELFGKDNSEALTCSIEVYSMLNETPDPDIICCHN